MDAAVGEVPVGVAGDAVTVGELLEIAQVVAGALRGDRGVLPSGIRGQTPGAACGQAGTVFPDPPQRRGTYLIVDVQGVDRAGDVDHRHCAVVHLAVVVADELHEQPRRTTRKRGNRPRPPAGANDIDDAGIEALTCRGAETEQRVGRVAGVDDVGVAEDHHGAYR